MVTLAGLDRPKLGSATAPIGTNATGAAIGVSSEPRPASNVVRMPYISPPMVGREMVMSRYWPLRLVTR